VVTELLEPSLNVDVGRLLGNVVHEQGTDSSTVVSGRDRKENTVRGG
jgi:hypothetical protein